MAVYTYFGSMEGMWKALRQEGFVRLGQAFERVPISEDPVRDLAALVAAYVRLALEVPDLYRVMFDANFELESLADADATLEFMVRAAGRGRDTGRFHASTVPLELATRSWVIGHGLVSLIANGPLPLSTLDNAVPMLAAVFVGAGDDPEASVLSAGEGWRVASAQAGDGRTQVATS